MIRSRAGTWMLALCAILAGCDDEGVGPEASVMLSVGTYAAEGSFGVTTFTTRSVGGDEVVDWLAAGASIRLELRSDMTTTGRLYVPGADEDGGDMDEDLDGTWSVSGDRVSLAHEADTFLRDMTLSRTDDELRGSATFGDTTTDVVLERR